MSTVFSKVQDNPYNSASCSICLEDFKAKDEVVQRVCQHIFHRNCDLEWKVQFGGFGGKCPICKDGEVLTGEQIQAVKKEINQIEKAKQEKREYKQGLYLGALFTAVMLILMSKDPKFAGDYGMPIALSISSVVGAYSHYQGSKIGALLTKILPESRSNNPAFHKGCIESIIGGTFSAVLTNGLALKLLLR